MIKYTRYLALLLFLIPPSLALGKYPGKRTSPKTGSKKLSYRPTATSTGSQQEQKKIAETIQSIHSAIKKGDFSAVKRQLGKIYVNKLDRSRNSFLHIAVTANKTQIVQHLLKKNADPNIQNTQGETPLHIAAQNSFFGIAKILIDAGTKMNLKNSKQKTPLDLATDSGTRHILEEKQKKLNTRFLTALTQGNISGIKNGINNNAQLFEKDIAKLSNINSKTINLLKTQVFELIDSQNVYIVKLLLSKDLTLLNKRNSKTNETVQQKIDSTNNILFKKLFASISKCFDAVKNNSLNVRKCIDDIININTQDENKNSFLHIAVERDYDHIVKILLDKRCNLELQDRNGFTPLHIAARKNSIKSIEFLLQQKININCEDNWKCTPVFWAAQRGHLEIIKKIITKYETGPTKKNIHLNPVCRLNNRYETPLRTAIDNEHHDIIKYLRAYLDNKILKTIHSDAISRTDELIQERIDFFIQYGATINARNTDGNTLLHLAIINNDIKLVNLLLKHNHDFTIYSTLSEQPFKSNIKLFIKNNEQRTPFLLARLKRTIKKILQEIFNKKLLESLESPDFNEQLILQLKRRTNFSSESNQKTTPLHLIAKRNHITLLDEFNNPDHLILKNQDGKTPLDLAKEGNYQELFDLLNEQLTEYMFSIVANQDVTGTKTLDECIKQGGNIFAKKNGLSLLDIDRQKNNRKYRKYLVSKFSTHLHTVKKLHEIRRILSYGANLNYTDMEGCTLLYKAVKKNNFPLIQYLVEHGANINLSDNKRNTPLHIAALNNNQKLVSYLITKGAYFNALNQQRKTPDDITSLKSIKEMLNQYKPLFTKNAATGQKNLEKKNIVVNIKNNKGETPLLHFVTYLKPRKPKRTRWGSTKKNPAKKRPSQNAVYISGLLNRKANISTTNIEGKSIFHLLIEKNHIDLINTVIQHTRKQLPDLDQLIAWAELKNKPTIKEIFKKIKQDTKPSTTRRVSESSTSSFNKNEKDFDDLVNLIKEPDNGLQAKHFNSLEKALISRQDESNKTLLHYAAQHGRTSIVKKLIEQDANMHATDNYGNTPFHLAVKYKQAKVLTCFKNQKLVTQKDSWGYTPLHVAAQQGPKEIVEILINKCLKAMRLQYLTSGNDKGEIPLHKAAGWGHTDIIESLLQQYPSQQINALNHKGTTPIHRAAAYGRLNTVKILLEKDPTLLNRTNRNSQTPLHAAVKYNHLPVVIYLLSKSANPNIACKINNKTETPLERAILNKQYQICYQLLQDHRTVINPLSNNTQTSKSIKLLYAAAKTLSTKKQELSTRSEAKGELLAELFKTFLSNNSGLIKPFLIKGLPIATTKHHGYTLLHFAILNNNQDLVTALLKKHTSLIEEGDDQDSTPLHFAAYFNKNAMIAHKLILAGANINATDQHGKTALHRAIKMGHYPITEFLVNNKKTDINIADKDGITPLHEAAIRQHALYKSGKETNMKTILLLRQNDANPLLTDKDNKKPIDYLPTHLKEYFNATHSKLAILHEAARYGYLSNLTKLLDANPALLDMQDSNEKTALHVAAEHDQLDITQELVKRGAKLNIPDHYLYTPIHWACGQNKKNTLEYLLTNKKIEMELPDKWGSVPLHTAAANGYLNIVKTLHLSGANLNCLETDNKQPVHVAALNGHLSVVKYLLTNKASLNTDDTGALPLHRAAQAGHTDVVNYLLTTKNINLMTLNKQTPLHLAVLGSHLETTRLLLENSASIIIRNKKGKTALEIATNNLKTISQSTDQDKKNTKQKVEKIIELFTPYLTEASEQLKMAAHTTLFNAIIHGNLDRVKKCIERYPNLIKALNSKTRTPLYYAVENEQESITQYLLTKNPNLEFCPNTSTLFKLLHIAAQKGNVPILKNLIKRNADLDSRDQALYTPFHTAVSFNQFDAIKEVFLLHNRKNLKAKDRWGYTPLHRAAQKGYSEIVALLLPHSDPEINDYYGYTPLHRAAEAGHLDSVKVFVKHNVNINAQSRLLNTLLNSLNTPLHFAILNNHKSVVTYLLEQTKIDCNIQNYLGKTPLHIAVDYNIDKTQTPLIQNKEAQKNYEIIKLLLNKKPNIQIKDKNNRTPLEIVSAKKNPSAIIPGSDIISLLKKYKNNYQSYPTTTSIETPTISVPTATSFTESAYEGIEPILEIIKNRTLIQKKKTLSNHVLTKTSHAQIDGKPITIREFYGVSSFYDKLFEKCARQVYQLNHPAIARPITMLKPSALLFNQRFLGTLYDMIKKIPTKNEKLIAIDIGEGLAYLHKKKIPFSDLNSKNILIYKETNSNKLRAKLVDIGFSELKEKIAPLLTNNNDEVPDDAWLAPEIFNDEPPTNKSEIYSYAIILWELASKQHPFKNMREDEIVEKVLNNERPALTSIKNHPFKDIITSCWETNPINRPTTNEVVQIITMSNIKQTQPIPPKQSRQLKIIHNLDQFKSKRILSNHTLTKTRQVKINNKLSTLRTLHGESRLYIKLFKKLAQQLCILKHPSISQPISICTTSPALLFDCPFLGTLYDMIKKIPTINEKLIAIDIGEGLAYLHKKKIPFSDLNSKNILIYKETNSNKLRAKLVDIGFSELKEKIAPLLTNNNDEVPDDAWLAPEIFNDEPPTNKSEIYSYAIILWELASKQHPFKNMREDEIVEKVLNNERPALTSIKKHLFKDIIISCWKTDPIDRPTLQNIIKNLN